MAIAELVPKEVIRIPAAARSLDGFRRWAKSLEFPEQCRISYIAGELYVEPNAEVSLVVPTAALTIGGFREWAKSPRFPERGRISFLAGELFIDMSPEAIETHNKVKTTVSSTLHGLVTDRDLGEFYGDRTLVTNDEVGLSTEPDGTFVAWESFETGRVRLVSHRSVAEDFVEVQGSPDMLLEVVSQSSEEKDTSRLKKLYDRAGVHEYWLIDARGERLSFQIFVRGSSGFVGVARSSGGWLRSQVFGCSFRLRRRRGRMNRWRYTLEIKQN